MNILLTLALLGAATAKPSAETQLVQICKSTHVQVVHLKVNSDDTDRYLEEVCASSLCHLSITEREACKEKKVVLDLLQSTQEYKPYHALEIFRNNMVVEDIPDSYRSLDGVSIRVTEPAKLKEFFVKMLDLMTNLKPETPKPYISISVDEEIKWSEIQEITKKVDHLIYIANAIPDCQAETDNVLCNLNRQTDDIKYMIDIGEYETPASNEVYDLEKFKTDFSVGQNFVAFIADAKDFGIETPASKVLSIQK